MNVLEAETNAESWICLFCSAPCRRVIFGIPYTLSSAIFCPRFIDALPQLMTRVPSSVLLRNSHSGPRVVAGLNIYHHGQQSLSSLGPGRRFQLSFPSSGVSLGPAWQEVPVDFSLFWEQTFPWKIRFIKYLPRSSIRVHIWGTAVQAWTGASSNWISTVEIGFKLDPVSGGKLSHLF